MGQEAVERRKLRLSNLTQFKKEVLQQCSGKEYLKPMGIERLPFDYIELKFETHENMLRFFVENEMWFHKNQVKTKVIGLSMIAWKRG